ERDRRISPPRRGQQSLDGLDVRLQCRVRSYQRGIPNITSRRKNAETLARIQTQMSDTTTTRRKDFLSVLDFDAADLELCLELGSRLKADRVLGLQAPTATALNGRYVAMLFEKSSLRTRTTFEVAVRELGGRAIGLQQDVALGQREPVADIARSLERWVDAVVIRTFSHHALEKFASYAC